MQSNFLVRNFIILSMLVIGKQSDSFALPPSCSKLTALNHPDNVAFCLLDGLMLLSKKDFLGAKDAFNAVLDVDPSNSKALVNRGWAELQLGNRDGALQDFRKSLAKLNSQIITDPADGESHHLRGALFRRVALFDHAIRDLERAVELSPKRTNYALDLKATRAEAAVVVETPPFSIDELQGGSSQPRPGEETLKPTPLIILRGFVVC